MPRTKTRNKGQNGKNRYYRDYRGQSVEHQKYLVNSISQVLYRRGSKIIRTEHLKWRVLGSFSNDDCDDNKSGKNAIARLD